MNHRWWSTTRKFTKDEGERMLWHVLETLEGSSGWEPDAIEQAIADVRILLDSFLLEYST